MDQITVVNRELEDGQRLLVALLADGLEVRAAFWAKPTEASKPYLYVVSPLVDNKGPRAAIEVAQDVVRKTPEVWIRPLDVRVVGVQDSLGEAALKAIEPSPALGGFAVKTARPYPGMTRIGEGTFGGLDIDWAFIYPAPTGAAAKQS